MNNVKGLVQDVRPQSQPDNTYRFGKNGIQYYTKDAIENELGFSLSAASIPGTVIGIIETDNYPVLFSVGANGTSYIGQFNKDEDAYISKFDDSTVSFKLGFNPEWYITGEFQRNYKNEQIVVWTDKNNDLYTFNLDDVASYTDLNNFRFFLQSTPAIITTTVETGGSLLRGAYYVFLKYTRLDGAETAYVANSAVNLVTNVTTGIGDKQIAITVSNMDTRYDKIRLAIVSKIDGVLSAVELEDISLPSVDGASLNYTYTGNEITTAATVTDVLTQPAVYKTVGALGQLNDSLYMANLTTVPEVKWQKYAQLIKVEWESTLIDVLASAEDLKNGKNKTLMAGEVYALYARLHLTDGTKTEAFHIPGRALTAADRATVTIGGVTDKKYQIDNTIGTATTVTAGSVYRGGMGAWENQSETYPDDVQYDASDIGGEDLRGQPVRHHRLPTLDYMQKLYSSSTSNFGRTQLAQLGIRVSNVIIPAELQARVAGIEILYAKRTTNNMTVIGQSTLEFSSYNQTSGPTGTVFSTGGNWRSVHKSKGNGVNWNTSDTYDALYPLTSNARFHSFDMLFNKPGVSISYVRPLLKMGIPSAKLRNYIISSGMVPARGGMLSLICDYTRTDGGTSVPTALGTKLLAMSNGKYLPANLLLDKYDNLRQELCYVGTITDYPELLNNPAGIPGMIYNIGRGSDWGAPTPLNHMADHEDTALCSLNMVREDVYNSFLLQTLVSTSTINPVSSGTAFTIMDGDCFLCDYSYITCGHTNNETPPSVNGYIWAGIRAVRRYVCMAASNINARYVVEGNDASRWYPHDPVILGGGADQFLFKINPGTEPNQFGYSKDLNSLNEINTVSVWNPTNEDITDYPYRIHRGGKVLRTGKLRSWQTLLPLDFYEAQKNMGAILNLCGYNDKLLIHHENCIFLTQDKAKLESSSIGVTLGSGDIFQFEPQEVLYSKLGYGGTQHDLACILTPMGYFFVDAKIGQVFLFDGSLKLLNLQMNQFMQLYARLQEKNVFIGNGITIGWDPEYKRLLFTVKNVQLSSDITEPVRYDYEATPEYFANYLVAGQTLVYKDGRIQRFLGVNTSTYNCDTLPIPSLDDYTFSVPERSPAGTAIGTIAATGGTGPYTYYVMTPSPYVNLGPTTGLLEVNTPPSYSLAPVITLSVKVVDANGFEATGIVTINVTPVTQGPTLGNYEFLIDENQPAQVLGTLIATPGSNPSIVSYVITDGEGADLFDITTSSNQGAFATVGPLDYEERVDYYLTVTVTDGAGLTGTGTVHVIVGNQIEPPDFPDQTFTVYDTAPEGSSVGVIAEADDPDGNGVQVYTAIDLTDIAGTFTVDLDNLIIRIATGVTLDPMVKDTYTFRLMVTNNNQMSDEAEITIKVLYDPAQYTFSSYGYSCTGGDCPSGSTVSEDGLSCVTISDVAAVPPVSGTPMTAEPRTNVVYTMNYTYIYAPGFNVNGTGARTAIPHSNPWWYNPYPPGTLTLGPLNRTGIWASGSTGGTDNPTNTWIGFTRYINIPEAKTYYIGMAGDNRCRVILNGTTIVQQDENALALQTPGSIDVAFKEWHIYPVSLPAGPNLLTLQGLNIDSVGAFGMEIYDNTPAEITAATSYAGLNIVFSTKDWRTGVIDTGTGSYTCSDPSYSPVSLDGGASYICRKITRVDRTPSNMHVNTVLVSSAKYPGRVIAVIPNVSGTVFQGRTVPYYPDVAESSLCSGTLFTNEAIVSTGYKDDCPSFQTGTPTTYTVPAGKYTSQIDQATVDAQAAADSAYYTQVNANLNGTCTPNTACKNETDLTVTNLGLACSGGEAYQIQIKVTDNTAFYAGQKVELQWYREGVMVYKQTTGAASGLSSILLMCVSQDAIQSDDVLSIRNVYC